MLSVKHRLKKKKDFENVFKNGKSAYGKMVGIKVLKNEMEHNRFGIIISTKISKKSVIRNRFKRQLRSILFEFEKTMDQGYDLVVICLKGLIDEDYDNLKKEIGYLLKRIKLLN